MAPKMSLRAKTHHCHQKYKSETWNVLSGIGILLTLGISEHSPLIYTVAVKVQKEDLATYVRTSKLKGDSTGRIVTISIRN